jgi:hypothetical protein
MSRTTFNFLLDTLLLILFVALLTSTVIVEHVFPPGPVSEGWILWGGDYLAWRKVSYGLLMALTLGIVLHVMLHWNWVCGVLASRLSSDKKARIDDGTQTILGVGFLIVLLLILGSFVAAAALCIDQRESTHRSSDSMLPKLTVTVA